MVRMGDFKIKQYVECGGMKGVLLSSVRPVNAFPAFPAGRGRWNRRVCFIINYKTRCNE